MDIFKLVNTGSTWANGGFIDDLETKVWSERYRSAGEFTFTGLPTRHIMDSLPLGTLISHTNTYDVMMVENHEITETKGESPKITITGRSIDSFLEQRVATDDGLGFTGQPDSDNYGEPGAAGLYDGSPWPYLFDQKTQRGQILALIRSQIQSGYTERSSFVLPDTTVAQEITDTSDEEEREVKRGPLYEEVLGLLADMGAGLRIERPHGTRTDMYWIIHDGTDRTSSIQFSHDAGDLATARYFRTNKSDKDAAYAAASYGGLFWSEEGSHTGFGRRVMFIDATDIKLNPVNAGPYGFITHDQIDALLTKRAKRIVRRKKVTNILEATLSRDTRFKYRKDYFIGDVVYVVGNYDTANAMRVVEYVETEDEDGERGYPTLVDAPGF